MTILLLALSFICLILVCYFMTGVYKIIFEKDKSFIEMNTKLLIIISMLSLIVSLLVRHTYAN
jgi:uncharacterized membrane protein